MGEETKIHQGDATPSNTDPGELAKFNRMAADWWNPDGSFKPLHDLNPARLSYVMRWGPWPDLQVVDVGCGAGLLSDAMARQGASVVGIDMAEDALAAARAHQALDDAPIDYQLTTAERFAARHPERFDLVTCLEMLEHVPEPSAVVEACARLIRPGGHVVFSTINRTLKAFALGILAAEYALGLLERGTHEYERLIRPSELARWARQAGLELIDLQGVQYRPFSAEGHIGGDVGVNYIACFKKAT